MLNETRHVGRLTRKPELFTSDNQKSYCYLTVAINSFSKVHERTDYLNFKAYGVIAENLCKYQDKGNLILIEGHQESYNIDGHTHQATIADRITYLEGSQVRNSADDDTQDISDSKETEISGEANVVSEVSQESGGFFDRFKKKPNS